MCMGILASDVMEKRKCEDVVVAKVTLVNNNGKKFFIVNENYIGGDERIENKDKIKIKDIGKENNILIVLESPHVKEYTKNFVSPAMGTTGKNIGLKLKDILDYHCSNLLQSNIIYNIIIMNAVKYQASFGVDTEKFRDRIWLSLWLKYGKRKEFISDLNKYSPEIIFNFCTNGSHKKDQLFQEESKYMNSIRINFIKSVCSKIVQKDKSLYCNGIEVCKAKNSRKYKDNLTYIYPLNMFVNNAINCMKANPKHKCIVFQGPHPSSWTRINSNFDIKTSIKKINTI